MNAQRGGQRWHLEEQELSPAHEVGLHHKQQDCAADEGKQLNRKEKQKLRFNFSFS